MALSVDTDGAVGLHAAAAFNHADYGAGYQTTLVPDRTNTATWTTKSTEKRAVIMTVSNADLNQGKVRVFIEYLVSE